MRKIDYIVIHCTATQPNTKKESILNYWKNTLKWKSVGYHRLIDANGVIHELAKFEQITNGVKGYNLKPFTYNNKTYFNVVLRHENKKDNSLYKKDIKVVKNEAKVSNIKSKEVIKQKNTEKDNYNVKYYILFLIIILLIIYYILKKYLRVI
jgi:hypothetical protein